MELYVVYLRGINVGGKNKIRMADLRDALTAAGFLKVSTYIQSGNIVLSSTLPMEEIGAAIEALLQQMFELDSDMVRVLVLDAITYQAILEERPEGFGEIVSDMDFRYDVLFPLNVSTEDVMTELLVREGVDKVWKGRHVIYFRRPGPNHPDYTKSALSRLIKKPIYQSITIRNFRTTLKMYSLLQSLK